MNTVTISTTLAIAITCMVIGFVTGGFIGIKNRDKQKKKPEETGGNTASGNPLPAPLADPSKYTELLRLWRGKEGNGLFVETSGHLLGSSEPLNTLQKNRFIELIKELADWLNMPVREIIGGKPETSKSPAEVPGFEPAAGHSEPIARPPVLKASEPIKTDPLPAAVQEPPVPAVPRASTDIQHAVPPSAGAQAPIKTPPEPAKKPAGSMVEQIDDILQEIIRSSDNPLRMIRLVEAKQSGVTVWVGQEHYEGIDAVTDQSAKDLIRAAVKEWDRRTENRG